MKTFTVTAALAPWLEQMSRDMAVPVEGLVNQALFNWARLHGYVEPSSVAEDKRVVPEAPETTRVPSIDEPGEEWRTTGGGNFARPGDQTSPRGLNVKHLVLVLANREVFLEGDRFTIGRDVSCNLTIESPRISRQHAVINVRLDAYELEDLGSSNGTWHRGQRIERRTLEHGDELFFGDIGVRVEFR